jgi:hypothetical protein
LSQTEGRPLTKIAFPTDEHYPFQDDHARSVALQIVADFKPDIRIAGSDGMDFYSISKYDKDPARIKEAGLQHEIDLWKAGQREWRDACPEAHAFFILGNHEDRLRRYLWRHPELADLDVLRLNSLLGLPSLNIYWEQEKGLRANLELLLHGRLLIKHGEVVRKHSAYAARAELESEFYAISILTGHTHRGGSHYATTRNGVVVAHEAFCLCRLDPPYLRNPNWQQGIVLATVDQTSLPSIEPVPFFQRNGKVTAIWREKEYVE